MRTYSRMDLEMARFERFRTRKPAWINAAQDDIGKARQPLDAEKAVSLTLIYSVMEHESTFGEHNTLPQDAYIYTFSGD